MIQAESRLTVCDMITAAPARLCAFACWAVRAVVMQALVMLLSLLSRTSSRQVI